MTKASTIDESTLIQQTLNVLNYGNSLNQKSMHFVHSISEHFYPHQCILVPRVAPKFRQEFAAVLDIYGQNNASLLTENQDLITIVRALGNAESSYSVGLTSDIEEDALRIKVAEKKISSFLILTLKSGNNTIGYLALLEESVPRLWAKKDLDLLMTITQIFSSFFQNQLLQKKLSEQETVLQKAIESSNDGFWHIDLVQNQMHFSRQWKRMLGFDDNEIEDSFESFEELIHPDDREIVLQVLDPYLKIGMGAYECEYRIRNKNDKYIWVLTRAHVNYSDNGVPLQFVATNTDITTRIDYKKKIAQSEAKYEKLVGSIHEIIFEIDKNGTILFLNEAWERHLLMKVKKTIGTNAINYIHPDHRAMGERVITTPFSDSVRLHDTVEIKFIAANGKTIWMEVHRTIRLNANQEMIGVRGTLINIDAKKRIELAKQESENKIARISDNISDIIVEIDEAGTYLFISNGVRNMLGRNPESFLGKNSMVDVHPEDRERVKVNLFDQLINGANRIVEQYRVRTGEGEYIWIESILQPLISVSGDRTFIAASRDISARRKIQEEIQAALQKEKELNELKSRFITMTSHEFRTPLSSIKSSVELLEMYAEDLGDRFMKPFSRHFEKITGQVGRINNLLNNIDTLGKIEAMEMPFHPEKQNLVEFIKNIINEQVGDKFDERTIDLEVIGEPRIIVYDPALLDNMICNVLKNALIYSSEGNPKFTIEFNDENIQLSIKDNGLGIPENEIKQLFTSFFRAQNIVNLNIPGNGLGLVIAKKIVDLHNGEIEVHSVEDEGTEVKVTLPNLEAE